MRGDGLGVRLRWKAFWCNALAAWLDRCTSRPGPDLLIGCKGLVAG